MQRHFALAACLMLVVSTVLSCDASRPPSAAAVRNGSPRIHVPHRDLEIGTVPLGPKDIEFEVYNHGDANLQLNGLETTCGCTQVDVADSIVPPGKRTVLTARISPRQPEQRSARITVYSNDPAQPKTHVSLSWAAVGPVSVEPLNLDFGSVRPSETAVRRLKLVYELDDGNARCEMNQLVCRPAELLKARRISEALVDRQWIEEWEITLNAGEGQLRSQGELVCQFDGCLQQEIAVTVVWESAGYIELGCVDIG